jgi:hypothetical protein
MLMLSKALLGGKLPRTMSQTPALTSRESLRIHWV